MVDKVILSKADESFHGESMYIPFNKDDAKKLKDILPGTVVQVTTVGTVMSTQLRKKFGEENEKGYVGELRIDVSSTKVKKHGKNDVEELFDGDI
jgi:hypothetical protein